MDKKLKTDREIYNTVELQVMLIFRCTTGLASGFLLPYMREDAKVTLDSPEAAFKILADVVVDLLERSKAREKLRRLQMRDGEDYHKFFILFQSLLATAEVPPAEHKQPLAWKLPPSLSIHVAEAEHDPDVDFITFSRKVRQVSLHVPVTC